MKLIVTAVLSLSLSVQNTPAAMATARAADTTLLRGMSLDLGAPLAIEDCADQIAKSQKLGAGCQVEHRHGVSFAFPAIEWQSFGAQDVSERLNELIAEQDGWGAGDGWGKDESAASRSSGISRILVDGDKAAARAFYELHSEAGGEFERFEVYSEKRRRTESSPVILMNYDQYDGNMVLHAFKAKRVGYDKVEILHTRISPLHLGYLRADARIRSDKTASGTLAANPFRKFYNPKSGAATNDESRYVWQGDGTDSNKGIDLAGAWTAAGEVARILRAKLVVGFIPEVEIENFESKKTSALGLKRKVTVHTKAILHPRWFYGIPAFPEPKDPKLAKKMRSATALGATTAICARGINSQTESCTDSAFLRSNLLVMKADAALNPHISEESYLFSEHSKSQSGWTFIAQIFLAALAVALILTPFGVPALTGAAIGGGLYLSFSLMNGSTNFADIQDGLFGDTVSDGEIANRLLAEQSSEMVPLNKVGQDLLRELNVHSIDHSNIAALRTIYNGYCDSDDQTAAECRKKYAADNGNCTATDTPAECRDKLGDGFYVNTGIVPRADLFPFVGSAGYRSLSAMIPDIPKEKVRDAQKNYADIARPYTSGISGRDESNCQCEIYLKKSWTECVIEDGKVYRILDFGRASKSVPPSFVQRLKNDGHLRCVY